MEISTIGLDLAKNVFQVHGISATGEVVIRKALRRLQMLPFFEKLPPCLIGAEACGTSHHWARELTKLGHEVRLMPAAYVKRGKNDAADAEAICKAVTRQTMRFVPIKSREQQAALSLHRVRSLLIKQRAQLVNMMRSVLAGLGIAIPVGIMKALQMAREIVDGESRLDLPTEATNVVTMLAGQLLQLHTQLRKLDLRLAALQRSDDRARRLATIPDRAGRHDRARRVGDRPKPVLVRASVRRLAGAGADAEAELEWRQGRLGAHYQDGADRMGRHGARRRLRTRACADPGSSIDRSLAEEISFTRL